MTIPVGSLLKLLVAVFGLLSGEWMRERRKRRELSENFEALKRRILHTTVRTYLPPLLLVLRDFLDTSGLVDKPKFSHFYRLWLTRPFIEMGIPMNGYLFDHEFPQMRKELSALKV